MQFLFHVKEVKAALAKPLRAEKPVGMVHDDGYYLMFIGKSKGKSTTLVPIGFEPGEGGGMGDDYVEWLPTEWLDMIKGSNGTGLRLTVSEEAFEMEIR